MRQHFQVFKASQVYYKDSLNYILTKFLLSNKLIIKAGWIDVGSRIDSKWKSMQRAEFFINRFKACYFLTTDHFTVVCSVTWPLNGSETGGDLLLIQTSLLLLCKSSCSSAN